MVALVGTIVGLTAHVIESAKETETSGDGITFVKGSDQPTATGTVSSYDSLSESYAFLPEDLDDIDTAYLLSDDESEEFSYTITGWSRNESHLVYYTSRGDTITVDTVGNLVTHDDAGNVLLERREGEGNGRRLLRRARNVTIFPMKTSRMPRDIQATASFQVITKSNALFYFSPPFMNAFVCVCGALHFGSDTFFGCNRCGSHNFRLPAIVFDVYK